MLVKDVKMFTSKRFFSNFLFTLALFKREPMSLPINEESWIDALPEHVKCDIFAAMTTLSLGKGEHAYSQNSESLALYRVKSGQIVIGNVSTNGKEFVAGLIETGSCFGELGLIDGLPRANSAYALGEAQLQVLSKSDFIRLRQLHREIADQLLLFVNHRLRLSYIELESIFLLALPQQLALRLYYLASRYYMKTAEGFEITLKISQESLGKALGVSRQSIHKTIKTLLEDDVVTIKNGHFIVPDLDRLKAYAEQ